jgi:xylan 1,4-beta-xylosidase
MIKASALFLFAALAACPAQTPAPADHPVSVHVDLNKSIGAYKPISSWFGYDEANYTTMKHGRELLGELHDLSSVPVNIRVHNLLTSGNGVPELKWSSSNVFSLDTNGKPVYDFTITDQTFDAFKSAGVRPMVELGFMPKDLAANVPGVSEYQIHYPRPTMAGASNNPPKDYKMWGELVRRYVAHLVQRYGSRQVSTWYFEVWNEPDIVYWHGTPQEYFKLYDYAAAGVRAALPNAKIGGPASTGPAGAKSSAFLQSFLEHCAHGKSAANGKPIPLDFISFHPKGNTIMADGHVQMGVSNELQAAQNGFRIVEKNPRFARLPIILSEADPEGCAACSTKQNPAKAYRNGPLYASYTAVALKALFELPTLRDFALLRPTELTSPF